MKRECRRCNADISHLNSRVRFCSSDCLRAPRFYGTYCAECGIDLVVRSTDIQKTKTCSRRCSSILRFKRENPEYNEDYFAEPNLENSYWAGFIAADGCIHVRPNASKILDIGLKSTDRDHLILLRDTLGAGRIYDQSTFDKRTGKTYHSTSYKLSSDKVCLDLAQQFNIHPRKSLVHREPNLVGDNALAFIAGYIDGDGSYTKYRNRPKLSIAGNYQFLTWVSKELGVLKFPSKMGRISCINFCGDEALEARSRFDSLDTPRLARKIQQWERMNLNLTRRDLEQS